MSNALAARLDPKSDERSRSKIQTSQLCNRLNMFALGAADPTTKRPVEMSDTQVRAALGLLRKTLPDLATTQIEGSVDGIGTLTALHLIAARQIANQMQMLISSGTKPNGHANGNGHGTNGNGTTIEGDAIDYTKPALE